MPAESAWIACGFLRGSEGRVLEEGRPKPNPKMPTPVGGPAQSKRKRKSFSLTRTHHSPPIPRRYPEGLRGLKGLQRGKGGSLTAPWHQPRHWAPRSLLLVTLAWRQASRPAKPLLLPLPPFSNLPVGPVRPSQSAEPARGAAKVLPLPRMRRGQPEKRSPLFPYYPQAGNKNLRERARMRVVAAQSPPPSPSISSLTWPRGFYSCTVFAEFWS